MAIIGLVFVINIYERENLEIQRMGFLSLISMRSFSNEEGKGMRCSYSWTDLIHFQHSG